MIEFLTLADIAAARGVSIMTVRRDISAGRLVPDGRTRVGVALFFGSTAFEYATWDRRG